MTDYNEQQRKEALRRMVEQADNSIEAQRKRAIEALGERWVLHPKHAAQRGTYNPLTGATIRGAA